MNIAIIGAGGVGTALARGWAAKGHDICFGARNVASHKVKAALASLPQARAASIADAVAWSDAVLLATPWSGTQEAAQAGADYKGKLLMDATNPLTPAFGLALGHTTSGGEQVQAWVPTASVVKIFNTTGTENMAQPTYPQGRCAMVFAGGDDAARACASQLAADLGFEPLCMGGLAGARYLEPAAMVWINLALVQKMGRNIGFGLMRR